MGCDIHSYAEVRQADGTWAACGEVFPLDKFDREGFKKDADAHPFSWRSYGMFGFLADVRNYSHAPVIAEPKLGIPEDASAEVRAAYESWSGDAHTATWLTLRQLLAVDYDAVFWDRRVTKQTGPNAWDGAALADEGEGEHVTLRGFLGTAFFEHLDVLVSLGPPDDVRIVFWFDN